MHSAPLFETKLVVTSVVVKQIAFDQLSSIRFVIFFVVMGGGGQAGAGGWGESSIRCGNLKENMTEKKKRYVLKRNKTTKETTKNA